MLLGAVTVGSWSMVMFIAIVMLKHPVAVNSTRAHKIVSSVTK